MPLEVLKHFEALTQSTIVEGYGLSETSPVTHVNPARGVRKIGSIGIALPDTDCRIVDLMTGEREVAPCEEGELLLKGPQVMAGYWRNESETAEALRDGWFHTGDIARMDKDGYVFIVDRKKDIILAGGFNVYPREIDEVLYEHPLIADAAAVGIPDPYRGETIKAFVVLKPGASLTEEDVIRFCRAKLAAFKAPRIVEFRDSLPKTLVGKVLRRELRAQEIARIEKPRSS
jgi:long-chain acyl-CoA synthetase